MKKDPYQIVKHQHVTEKAQMLSRAEKRKIKSVSEALRIAEICVYRRSNANKQEIAQPLKKFIARKKVKVAAVNTINVKAKATTCARTCRDDEIFKKAIVTFEEGD